MRADLAVRLLGRSQGENPPSGIAQLRRSSEQATKASNDHMNLDDFIVPSSIGTPAGVSPAPSSGPDEFHPTTGTTASAIPIKQQQRVQAEELHPSRASAPSVPTLEQNRAGQEFKYVQRHVRKTSVDERRVRECLRQSHVLADRLSRPNDELRHHRKFRR